MCQWVGFYLVERDLSAKKTGCRGLVGLGWNFLAGGRIFLMGSECLARTAGAKAVLGWMAEQNTAGPIDTEAAASALVVTTGGRVPSFTHASEPLARNGIEG